MIDTMVSYSVAEDFLLLPLPKGVHDTVPVRYGGDEGGQGTGGTVYNDFELPADYVPKINKIGQTSQKIYISDGGKYSNGYSANIPNYVVSFSADCAGTNGGKANSDGTSGGAYADYGAWDFWSRALCCAGAPGNAYFQSGNDPRIFGFRHGSTKAFGPADSFLFNAGFFDGHVETLGDLQGANPSFWNPPGTICSVGPVSQTGLAIQGDTQRRYMNGITSGAFLVSQ